jgi:hypothetical protein
MVRYLEHLDSLGLGHANLLKSWVGCKYLRKFQDVKDPKAPRCFVVGAFRSVKF